MSDEFKIKVGVAPPEAGKAGGRSNSKFLPFYEAIEKANGKWVSLPRASPKEVNALAASTRCRFRVERYPTKTIEVCARSVAVYARLIPRKKEKP